MRPWLVILPGVEVTRNQHGMCGSPWIGAVAHGFVRSGGVAQTGQKWARTAIRASARGRPKPLQRHGRPMRVKPAVITKETERYQ